MTVFKAMDQITMSGLRFMVTPVMGGNMRGLSLRSTWNCQSFAELKSDQLTGRFFQFKFFGLTPSAKKRMRSGVDGLLRFAVATRSAITGNRRQRRLSCLQPYRPCLSRRTTIRDVFGSAIRFPTNKATGVDIAPPTAKVGGIRK